MRKRGKRIQQLLTKVKVRLRWVLVKDQRPARKLPVVIYPDDTFLVSYPRSGNAWLRRLIACMRDPEADISVENIDDYVPDIYSVGAKLNSCKRPRIMKSHESYQPNYPRVIYLVRDGRDVAVSYYNYYQTLKGHTGSFDEFMRRFLSGEVAFGAWQDNVHSWVFRHHANPFILVRYEQLHRDPYGVLRQLADFIQLDADDARVGIAVQKCTFESLKKDIRENTTFWKQGYHGGVKGAPEAWKETFTEELLDLFWSQAGETMEQIGYG